MDSSSEEISKSELAKIIETKELQSLMDEFYILTKLPMSIIDLEGNILVGIGWQDICTKFHRTHPESRKHCIESDTQLSGGLKEGEFKIYKCNNNMWDIATPIVVEGKHVGNIFMGQFFFEDDHIDYELFRKQARKYGFDEKKYIAALERTPRWSKETVNQAMNFYIKLAHLISTLGNKNVKLSQALEDYKQVERELKEERSRLLASLNFQNEMLDTAAIWINMLDEHGRVTFWNKAAEEISGYKGEEVIGSTKIWEWLYPDPDYRAEIMKKVQNIIEKGQKVENLETKIKRKDGTYRIISWHSNNLLEDGKIVGSIALGADITERKKSEERLKEREEALGVIYENAPITLMLVDEERKIIEINGYSSLFADKVPDDLIGQRVGKALGCISSLRFSEEELEGTHCEKCRVRFAIMDTFETGRSHHQIEVSHYFQSENIEEKLYFLISTKKVSVREKPMVLVSLQNITELRQAQEEIHFLTSRDPLTGNYNRVYLDEEMERLDAEKQLPVSIIIADLNGLKVINDTYGHLLGDEMLKTAADILNESCREKDIIARWGGDEFVVLLPLTSEEEVKSICTKIAEGCREASVENVPISLSLGAATKASAEESLKETLIKAENNLNKNKLTEQLSTRNVVLDTFLKVLEEKSFETKEHTQKMQDIALEIGSKIGLPDSELKRLQLLITLHDIGKINISEEILKKKEGLDDKEWEIIKKHPETGYRIVQATEEFAHVANDILAHHEHWDGGGYPLGLKGEEIPLLARIVAVTDAYEVMVNGRPYKEPLAQEKIIDEFKKCSGEQFDPRLVETFLEILEKEEYYKG